MNRLNANLYPTPVVKLPFIVHTNTSTLLRVQLPFLPVYFRCRKNIAENEKKFYGTQNYKKRIDRERIERARD